MGQTQGLEKQARLGLGETAPTGLFFFVVHFLKKTPKILSCHPFVHQGTMCEICLNLHLGEERLQITSGLSLGGGPSSDYAIGILISLDVQLMKGTKG